MLLYNVCSFCQHDKGVYTGNYFIVHTALARFLACCMLSDFDLSSGLLWSFWLIDSLVNRIILKVINTSHAPLM